MVKNERPVVLLGGGTGGHIFPLVSLRKAFLERGFGPFYWIGESDSLEEKIAATESVAFVAIRSGKLRRYFSWKTFVEPFNVATGFFQSLSALRSIRPEFVFSKGGYVSLPGAIAAKCLGIPVFLQESDSIPGLSNRWVAKFSQAVFLGFPEAAEYFPNSDRIVSGQLLDPSIPWGNFPSNDAQDFSTDKASVSPDAPKTKTVLAIGGSLGSSRVFSAVRSSAESLPDVRFEIVLGKLNSGMRSEFESLANVTCFDFLSQIEMAKAYARADLVITRAGATSLAEVEASGTGMVIVPLEGSANDHQRANASAYAKRGYPVVFERELDGLPQVISESLSSKTKIDPLPHTNGVSIVCDEVIRRLSPAK